MTPRRRDGADPAAEPGRPVVVVGGGIAGIACARQLHDRGVPVVVRDRGRAVGGRMTGRVVDGRVVDVGAAYLTVREPEFRAVAEHWLTSGLIREWTDTFHLADARGIVGTTTGPLRYASTGGLRALVADLADGLDVRSGDEVEEVTTGPLVDGEPAAAVVLAMPDPPARDLLGERLIETIDALGDEAWEPGITLYAGWDERGWPEADGVFLDGSPVLRLVVDDGRRRGDGAPILVAYSGAEFAATHLDEPEAALAPMLRELERLGVGRPPRWAHVRRWSLAQPTAPRPEPFHLGRSMIGLCGDGWSAPARVEAAYLSGSALGRRLADLLSAG